MSAKEWEDPQQRSLLLHLGVQSCRKQSFCLLVNNTEQQLHFVLPKDTYGLHWQVSLDTSTPTGQPNVLLSVQTLSAHSLKLLELH